MIGKVFSLFFLLAVVLAAAAAVCVAFFVPVPAAAAALVVADAGVLSLISFVPDDGETHLSLIIIVTIICYAHPC